MVRRRASTGCNVHLQFGQPSKSFDFSEGKRVFVRRKVERLSDYYLLSEFIA